MRIRFYMFDDHNNEIWRHAFGCRGYFGCLPVGSEPIRELTVMGTMRDDHVGADGPAVRPTPLQAALLSIVHFPSSLILV